MQNPRFAPFTRPNSSFAHARNQPGQKKQELYNIDYAVPIDSYFFSVAITSTSIIAPRGSAATWKQLRAGYSGPK